VVDGLGMIENTRHTVIAGRNQQVAVQPSGWLQNVFFIDNLRRRRTLRGQQVGLYCVPLSLLQSVTYIVRLNRRQSIAGVTSGVIASIRRRHDRLAKRS
jgi:hypothetical protein